jgi:hypothetical protein
LFLEGLLADEQRKTGWMRAAAGGDPGPWRQQAILGRRWDATGESFADVAMQRQRSQKDDSEAVSDWRYVGLMPLAAPEEIKAFANPEASFDDIHKRDAED